MDDNALANYSFLPWLRQGIANNIKSNPGAGRQRASIQVSVDVASDSGLTETAHNTVELIGPGDIVGISDDAVIRHEPRDWITDFEPNYLPFIEFYDEDFPWRYSPMPADVSKHRITPWLTLVVLTEDEFEDFNALSGPLPFFDTTGDPVQVFPARSQLWAWAHVHVNVDLLHDDGGQAVGVEQSVDRLEGLLKKNSDIGYSRLICPRRLTPNTAYHAFLIPTFESGRRSGLGLELDGGVQALDLAWGNGQGRFPYYYRWYFRSGRRGDFEYLVRLLKPRLVDKRVGIRDMDVSDPGGGLEGIDMGPGQPQVIGMEGALKSPQTESTPWPQDYPEPFQEDLAGLINRPDDDQQAVPDSDPVITPPLYGGWHALRRRLSLDADNFGGNPYDPQRKWLTEMNLDPRNRAAAGLGMRVVQKNQEKLMNRAWRQIGDVLEANRRLRLAQLAQAASFMAYRRHLQPMHLNLQLSTTSPVHRRVLGSSTTVGAKVAASRLPEVLLSPEARRVMRPRGPLARRMLPEAGGRPLPDLIERVNQGEITATPPKKMPSGAVSLGDAQDALLPRNLPPWLIDLLRYPWFRWLPLLLLGLLLIVAVLAGLSLIIGIGLGLAAAVLVALTAVLNNLSKQVEAADSISEDSLTPEAVEDLPESPGFEITDPEEEVVFTAGDGDSEEAQAFKTGLAHLHAALVEHPPVEAELVPLDLAGAASKVMVAINPKFAVFQMVMASIRFPPPIRVLMPDRIVPVMAYPEFPQPMYEPLRDMSTEWLIPNIGLVPQNTISLLITNQKFIESYMVGLSHAMGQELLWREYPTDQRGSYFRQFWDVRDYVPRGEERSLSRQELAEKLKDIPEIHTWLSTNPLGAHNHRDPEGDLQQLVVLIRGELLKRYPNTVIYAHRARWQENDEGQEDRDLPRTLAPAGNREQRDANQRYPLYSAQLKPDVYFLGFNLTADEARGDGEDDPGWFIVLKERPGEPRFGLDLEDEAVDADLEDWDDMSWSDIEDDLSAGGLVRLTADKNKVKPDNNPDGVEWNSDSNSADVAYILFQDPVLVAVHADDMLPAS